MFQTKLYDNIPKIRMQLRRKKQKQPTQISIHQAIANLKIRRRKQLQKKSRERQKVYRQFKKKWKQMKEPGFIDRFKYHIAYVVIELGESIDLEAYDTKKYQKVGTCAFSDLLLNEIFVSPTYQKKGIASMFVRIATKYLPEPPRFCVNPILRSRYNISSEAMPLIKKGISTGLIKPSQLEKSPIHSPSYDSLGPSF